MGWMCELAGYVSCLVGWLVSRSVGLVDGGLDGLLGWSWIDWLVGWSVEKEASWLVGWFVGQVGWLDRMLGGWWMVGWVV